MTRHLLKLVWNRKGSSALIIAEIFFSFLVVCVVATLGLHFWRNLQVPLGYDYRDVWVANMDPPKGEGLNDPEAMATFERLLAETRALPPVLAAAGAMTSPYGREGWAMRWSFGGRTVDSELGSVGPGYEKVLGIELAEGRFFEPADRALAYEPMVINRALAREVFGEGEAVGKRFEDDNQAGGPERRVIGVVEDFRRNGELAAPGNFLFIPIDPKGSEGPPRKLTFKVRPGTPAAFEEELARRLQAVAPLWSFEIAPLAQLRDASFRTRLTPLLLGGIVALFLILMVGLGLVGVLWQNLLQRTRELGLRRAVGASRGDIHRQVLFEQLILASFGIGLGVAVVAQLPLLGLDAFIPAATLGGGSLLAMLAIYLLAALCALYPSFSVSRTRPADALRYE